MMRSLYFLSEDYPQPGLRLKLRRSPICREILLTRCRDEAQKELRDLIHILHTSY